MKKRMKQIKDIKWNDSGIVKEDIYVDAAVKAKLEKSKKIPSSLWYPHKSK